MSKLLKYGEFLSSVSPHIKVASAIIKGVSFFKNRAAEQDRIDALQGQYDEDLGTFTGEVIPETVAKYKQQGEYYRSQGDLSTAMIYDRAISTMEQGGQTNLAYGSADVARGQGKNLLDMSLQSKAASAMQMQTKNQQALGSALNRTQMQIDAMGAEYAKQGLPVDEYNIDTDLKYV